MKIFKKIAVRAIPTALLAFLIFAAIAYQRGLYDFTFIERTTGPEQNPDTLPDNSTDMPIVDDMTASDTTDTGTPVDSSDETTIIDGTVTDAPEEDEVSKFLSLMSTTQDLVSALKSELRAAGVTYADLADALGMSESSVKRVFAKSDMPLSRIDEMLRVLKMDFAELARKVADAQPLLHPVPSRRED